MLVHVAIVGAYHGPWVFADELGYQRLAESLGRSGDLALFGKRGLSYSPLYPLVLAPIYALHASAQSGYLWAKVVNCCLLALALLPIYKISRSLLTRPQALVAAALAAFAPLMLFSSLEMSESLAYPLCLFAIWAMLATIRSPSWRGDAVVLVLCILCTAARLQFIVLLPAALVAVVADAAFARDRPGSAPRRALAGLREHRLLGAATAALVLLALAALAGTAALSLAGRYANQDTLPIPSPWLIVKLVAWHVAGLVFTVAVIPFAGTLLAAWLWLRGRRSRPEVTSFAAVSLSVTAFIVLITAVASYGQSYAHSSGGDLPRIHERYMFYVLPLFLVAMLATTRLPRSTRLLRAGAAAALLTGLLPLIIPWRSVMNDTIAVDTFGFSPFAAGAKGGGIQAQPHAALLAAGLALCLGFVYVLARPNIAVLAMAVAATFVGVSIVAQSFLVTAARSATATTLPARADWVDAAGRRRRRHPRVPHDDRRSGGSSRSRRPRSLTTRSRASTTAASRSSPPTSVSCRCASTGSGASSRAAGSCGRSTLSSSATRACRAACWRQTGRAGSSCWSRPEGCLGSPAPGRGAWACPRARSPAA